MKLFSFCKTNPFLFPYRIQQHYTEHFINPLDGLQKMKTSREKDHSMKRVTSI